MFSSIFGKRRSSPTEDDTPPIPGPRSDDNFVIVNPSPPRGGLYPNVSGGPAVPYPQRPAPTTPVSRVNAVDQFFHYLQGVPFSFSRELKMAVNKDAFGTEIGDLLAYLTKKINLTTYSYDFSVEKSVLKEC